MQHPRIEHEIKEYEYDERERIFIFQSNVVPFPILSFLFEINKNILA